MSYCYLLHFAVPIGNPANRRACAQHYLGFTSKGLHARLDRHYAGNGAAIMGDLIQRPIPWALARTWTGNRATEKQLKARHNARQLCPICRAEKEFKPYEPN
jgi:hypothetical protein